MELLNTWAALTALFLIMKTTFVHCSRCGARVSNHVTVVDGGLLAVRAFVECGDCVEKQPDGVLFPSEHIEASASTLQVAAQMLRDANINGAGIVIAQLKVIEKLLSSQEQKSCQHCSKPTSNGNASCDDCIQQGY